MWWDRSRAISYKFRCLTVTGGVAVVGSLNVDTTMSVLRLPGAGETVMSIRTRRGYGGKGANQAAAAAAAGGQVRMIGRVGTDAAGRSITDDLAAHGIDVSAVWATSGHRTGGAVVMVAEEQGENMIVVDAGANAELTPSDVRVAAVRDSAVVLSQLEIPVEAVVEAALTTTGLFMLNPAPARELPGELLDRVDVLLPNQSELATLTGNSLGETVNDTAIAAKTLGLRGDVVVTMGSLGALVYEPARDMVTHIAAPATEVIDTTGAGDSFCGVLAARLAGGARLVDAVRVAVAAASRSTAFYGARPEAIADGAGWA